MDLLSAFGIISIFYVIRDKILNRPVTQSGPYLMILEMHISRFILYFFFALSVRMQYTFFSIFIFLVMVWVLNLNLSLRIKNARGYGVSAKHALYIL